ncbi:hypothetical protein K438DRAFT_101205 [Mycena galopus ATCC 62051]|nr:hypothetical protein K438DRAFT_101205 [Mycena galopus ATCC 62051]
MRCLTNITNGVGTCRCCSSIVGRAPKRATSRHPKCPTSVSSSTWHTWNWLCCPPRSPISASQCSPLAGGALSAGCCWSARVWSQRHHRESALRDMAIGNVQQKRTSVLGCVDLGVLVQRSTRYC